MPRHSTFKVGSTRRVDEPTSAHIIEEEKAELAARLTVTQVEFEVKLQILKMKLEEKEMTVGQPRRII